MDEETHSERCSDLPKGAQDLRRLRKGWQERFPPATQEAPDRQGCRRA